MEMGRATRITDTITTKDILVKQSAKVSIHLITTTMMPGVRVCVMGIVLTITIGGAQIGHKGME